VSKRVVQTTIIFFGFPSNEPRDGLAVHSLRRNLYLLALLESFLLRSPTLKFLHFLSLVQGTEPRQLQNW
jgi:hypothetical protein